MADVEIVSDESFDDGLNRELAEACDVKGCGKTGVGHMSVGGGGQVWLCLEHEPRMEI